MDITELLTERFAAGKEIAFCADGTFPFQITKEEFDAMPVPENQKLERDEIYRLAALAKIGPLVENSGITNIASNCKLVHRFSPGIYCREFHMPKGSVIVSRRHAREHICIVSKGSLTVKTEHGTEIITAPATFISHAGCKRVGFIHEDTIWTTVHASFATSVEEAEAELLLNEDDENRTALTAVLSNYLLERT